MTNKYLLSAMSLVVGVALAGCAALNTAVEKQNPPTTQTTTGQKSDYPTRDRVEYVLACIAQHGGLNYINQYACGCKIDKIAEKLSFEDYDAAKTFTNLRSVPGESGAAFRDPVQAKNLKTKLKEADAAADKACFVK